MGRGESSGKACTNAEEESSLHLTGGDGLSNSSEVNKKQLIIGYILMVESKGFADILKVREERQRRVMDSSKVYP